MISSFARVDRAAPRVAWLILGLLALPLMLSQDSLWIDEAQTAAYAALPGPAEVWQKIRADNLTGGLSEGLMPLSMYLAWGWAKVLGTSEWALRLPNLFYLAAGLAFAWRAGASRGLFCLPLFIAFHPFLWYYADEARPYALQIALGCALLWTVLKLFDTDGHCRVAWGLFLGFAFLLCASSLLCIIPVGAASAIILGYAIAKRWEPTRFHLLTIAVSLPFFLLLGLFYFNSLRGTPSSPKLWEFGPSNLAYSLYELLGFQGLGPNRADLREAARSGSSIGAAFLPHLPALVGLGLTWAITAGAAVAAWRRVLNPTTLRVALILLTSLIGYAMLGLIMKFPFWGRHLAPMLAFSCFASVAVIAMLPSQPLKKGLLLLLFFFSALSSLSIRFSPRFTNDDYRGATGFAREQVAKGDHVWWAADTQGARYYGLTPADISVPGAACYAVRNNSSEDLSALPPPRWVVLTKPDIYDSNGRITAFLKDGGYQIGHRFASFSIWTR